MVRVGVLTAGGDCPGLNAVIRSVVRRIHNTGGEVVGFEEGYRGLAEDRWRVLDLRAVSGVLPQGGTILKTSSYNPFRHTDGVRKLRHNAARLQLDGLIAIGGDHTMHISRRLYRETGFPVVGVPKTIDNDIVGTDYTFGFDTAVQIATDAIDRLHSTAESHDRVMVLEVMGRDAGWIATHAGIAGGADVIVIPEWPLSVEEVAAAIQRRHRHGKSFSIVVVAEGAPLRRSKDDEGALVLQAEADGENGYRRFGGVGAVLATELERLTGFETRYTALGHIQRGGSPTAADRLLATRYGLHAAELVLSGRFGRMVALRHNEITDIPLEQVEGNKRVGEKELQMLRQLLAL